MFIILRIAFRANMKKAIRFSMNSNGPGRHKSFTHIENREGREGLVN